MRFSLLVLMAAALWLYPATAAAMDCPAGYRELSSHGTNNERDGYFGHDSLVSAFRRLCRCFRHQLLVTLPTSTLIHKKPTSIQRLKLTHSQRGTGRQGPFLRRLWRSSLHYKASS